MNIKDLNRVIIQNNIKDLDKIGIIENLMVYIDDSQYINKYIEILNRYKWSDIAVKIATDSYMLQVYEAENHLSLLQKILTSKYVEIIYDLISNETVRKYRDFEGIIKIIENVDRAAIYDLLKTLIKNEFLLKNYSADDHIKLAAAILKYSKYGSYELALDILLDENIKKSKTVDYIIKLLELLFYNDNNLNVLKVMKDKNVLAADLSTEDLEKIFAAMELDDYSDEVTQVVLDKDNLSLPIIEQIKKIREVFIKRFEFAYLRLNVENVGQYNKVLKYLTENTENYDISLNDEIEVPRLLLKSSSSK